MSRSRVRRVFAIAMAMAAAVAALLRFQAREPDYSKAAVSTVADLERELESLRARLGIPGMSAAIAEGDRVVWAHGFGWANLERRTAADPVITSLHLASVFLQEYRGSLLAWQFGQAFESSSLLIKIPDQQVTFVVLANSDGLSRRRRLGDHGNVFVSPAAMLFLNWYSSGMRLR